MSMGFPNRVRYDDSSAPWSESSDNSNGSSRSSSTQSWIDDTEESVTRELKEQYERFEEALYTERSPDELSKGLQAEVRIWSEHSPHIRVRGVSAKLHERPETLPEEDCDSSYEEIIESHGSLEESLEKSLSFSEDVRQVIQNCTSNDKEIIKTDLKNAIVDKLFDHALPRVLEKFEPVIKSVSAGKHKSVMSSIAKSERYVESLHNQQNLRASGGRSVSSRSQMKEVISRKPRPLDDSSEYQCVLSSRGLRRNEAQLSPQRSSHQDLLQVPRVKLNRALSLATHRSNGKPSIKMKERKARAEDMKGTLLPVIQALPITPKAPDKRSVSAMVRFTKTLPRVRPNKIVGGSKSRGCGGPLLERAVTDRPKEKSPFQSDLEVVGTRSATSLKSTRWRY